MLRDTSQAFSEVFAWQCIEKTWILWRKKWNLCFRERAETIFIEIKIDFYPKSDCNRHIFSSVLLFYQSNGKVLLKPQYFPPYLFVEIIVFFGLHYYRPSKKITFGKFSPPRSESTVSVISECTKNFVTDSQSSKEAMIYNNMNFGAIITTIILIILETIQLPDYLRSIFITLERTCNVFFVCDIVLILISRIENLRGKIWNYNIDKIYL